MKQFIGWCGGLVVGAALAAAAESNGALSLEALVAETLAKNPEAKFYEAEIAAARGEGRGSGQWQNPSLTIGGGYWSVRSPGAGLLGEGPTWAVSLAQPIEWPGRLSLRKAIADRQVEVAQIGLDQFKAVLRQRAMTLAYRIVAERQKAAAARAIAERFNTLREVLVQRDPAGVTPQLEVRILEATALTQQRRANDAAVAERTALAELNQLRGLPPATALALEATLPPFPPVVALDDLLRAAATENFDLRARAAELTQQGFAVDLSRRERTPGLTLAPYVNHQKADTDELQAGLMVTFPLPFNSAAKGREEAAKARLIQAEAMLATTQREVERRVTEAALRYEVKRSELLRWGSDPDTRFAESAELADRHYRLGAVPIGTYVEAQKAFLDVLEMVTDTRAAAMAAWLELETLTGRNRQSGGAK
jgi:cobalt-zinc-cadmium efflux system outer membrane protein